MKQFATQMLLINRGARRESAWAHTGLILGGMVVFFLFLLGTNSVDYMDTHVLGAAPDDELVVSLKTKDAAFFRVADPSGKAAIESGDMENINGMSGVADIWPLTYGVKPAYAEINFMGRRLGSELTIQGFDPDWLKDDVDPELLKWERDKPIPVVINSQILSIFNNSYAKSQGLPQLSAGALMTPVWVLTYNHEKAREVKVRAQIVGMSPKVALAAAIPHEVLASFHHDLGLEEPEPVEMVLRVKANADADTLRRSITEMGFSINEPPPISRIMRQMKTLGAWGIIILTGCLLFFGFSYLNQTLKLLYMLKRKDYAVCRAIGMSRKRLQALLAAEVLLLLVFDMVVAICLGWLIAHIFKNQWLNDYLIRLVGFPLELHVPLVWIMFGGSLVITAGLAFLWPRILAATGPADEPLMG